MSPTGRSQVARSRGPQLRAALADLVLGVRCAGCEAPGVRWCTRCRGRLRGAPVLRWPQPAPPALVSSLAVPPASALVYEGVVPQVLASYKERGRTDLTPVLGDLLAAAVARALGVAAGTGAWDGVSPVLLVPVPSRREVVRRRGRDAVADLAVRAAARLRTGSVVVRARRGLRVVRPVADQAGLDAAARRENLHGAFGPARDVAGRLARAPGLVVVVDDVLTTGASATEAVRVVSAIAAAPTAVATLAAARRRRPEAVGRRR